MKEFEEKFTAFLVNGIKQYQEFHDDELHQEKDTRRDRQVSYYHGLVSAYSEILAKFFSILHDTNKNPVNKEDK